jgi:hypothetical protein
MAISLSLKLVKIARFLYFTAVRFFGRRSLDLSALVAFLKGKPIAVAKGQNVAQRAVFKDIFLFKNKLF